AASGLVTPVDGVKFIFNEAMSPTDVENAFNFTVNGVRQGATASWTGGNTVVTFTFGTIPSGTALVSMSSGAQDAAGNNLANPVTNDTFTIGGGNVIDYMVTNSAGPASGTPGGAITGLTFDISNIGQINGAQNVNWTAYISANTTYEASDQQIGSGSIPALNGGASSTGIVASTLGTNWPLGTGKYYLIVKLNATDDQVATNNTYVSSTTTPVGVPDYIITGATFPGGGAQGGGFSGSFSVTNQGTNDGALGGVTYNVYLSTTTSITGATNILTGNTGQLLQGQTAGAYTYNGTWGSAGNYYIIIKITASDDAVTTNNTSVSPIQSVSGTPQPDYIIVTPTYPVSSATGSAISGTFNIRNQGGAAGTSNVNWVAYKSSDAVLDAFDTAFSSGTHPAIAANTTSTTTINYSGLAPATPGNYYIILSVSATDDSVTTNNTSISPAISATGFVDYRVSTLTTNPGSYYVGGVASDTVSGSFRVDNAGSNNGASGFTWTVKDGASLIQSGTGAAINAGSWVNVSFSGPLATGTGTARTLTVTITPSGTDSGTVLSASTALSTVALTAGNPIRTSAPTDALYIGLSWPASTGADNYKVFRSTNGGTYSLITTTVTAGYLDYDTYPTIPYSYKIQATRTQGAISSVSVILSNQQRQGKTVFLEDFSNVAAPGWYQTLTGGSATGTVRSGRYEVTGTTWNDRMGRDLGPLKPSYLKYQFMQPAANTGLACYFVIKDTTDNELFYVHVTDGGFLRISDDTGNFILGPSVTRGGTYTVELKMINWSTKSFDLYFNFVRVGTYNFKASALNFAKIWLNDNVTGDTAVYDNIEFRE
ncbi:MAG: hypothetical protein OEZ36_02695, partial [Spirochaetota bacterium]|nr:hypothetical protein [Spirochaetota bacterium]